MDKNSFLGLCYPEGMLDFLFAYFRLGMDFRYKKEGILVISTIFNVN